MKKNYAMEAYEAPMLEELTIEVEQGFAVSGGPEMYTLAGGETF